jgi:hypothetical protein
MPIPPDCCFLIPSAALTNTAYNRTLPAAHVSSRTGIYVLISLVYRGGGVGGLGGGGGGGGGGAGGAGGGGGGGRLPPPPPIEIPKF